MFICLFIYMFVLTFHSTISFSQGHTGANPPTPPGSTGCESASGSPLCPPSSGFRWSWPPPGVPPRNTNTPPWVTILSAQKAPAGRLSGKTQFCLPKRPLRDAFPVQNAILSAQKAPAGRPSVIPKAKYMTLGPKFFCFSKMAVTRRRKHLFQ